MVSQRLEEVLSYLSEGLEAKVFDKKTIEELKYLNPPAALLSPSRRLSVGTSDLSWFCTTGISMINIGGGFQWTL